MRWLERFRVAMSMLFRRRTATARLNEELEFHLEQQVAENIARGLSPEEARSAALRSFGNPALLRDQARSSWSWNWIESFVHDVRYGARTLSRSPGFSLVAILVIALGIGATTSLFTIVRAVLLKPLPFRDPGKLVMVYEHFRGTTSANDFNVVAPADFRDWRQKTHGFQDMSAWRRYTSDLTGDHAELPEVVQAAGGSSNLFSLLGVQPALGRTFAPDEDTPGGRHVVLLTWSLFQRRFAGNPAIVGQQVRLDTTPYTVIGVLPRWFTYPDARVQLWAPYASTFTQKEYDAYDSHQSYVVARLRPGVSAAAATNEVSALQYQNHLAHAAAPVAEEARYRPMLDDLVENVKTPLIVLLCAVGCMLLIACLNVSNLLVARGAARRKEIAVRGALGGGRLTLIRQQMTESLLICAAGGTLGVLLSLLATRWLASQWRDLPRADAIYLDAPVIAFALGLVFLTALLAGLLPAISSTGKGVFAALQESSRSIGGSTSRATLRRVLLTAEIALTVVLLISAGLLFKSFLHLRTSDLGCATDHVLTMKYSLPKNQYDTRDKIVAFHESLLERVRRLPGVRAAALVSTPPGGGYENDFVFTIPGRPADSFQLQYDAMSRTADPGYFMAMQIPLISGRFFSDQERLTRDHYIVISKKFADQFFPGDNPIGRQIKIGFNGETYQIIGVAGDTLWSVTQPSRPTIYFPILSGNSGPDEHGDDRSAHGRRPALAFHSRPAASGRARSSSAGLKYPHHAADSGREYGQPELQRHPAARLRRSVFAARRHRPLWSALLSCVPAHYGDRHPNRAWGATGPAFAAGAARWITARLSGITYRPRGRTGCGLAYPLSPLRNQPARSSSLRRYGWQPSAHGNLRVRAACDSRLADRTHAGAED